MEFFKKRGVALAVLVIAIVGAVFIGQSRKDGFIAKKPVALPEVKYQHWICDEAGMLSETTVDAIRQYNSSWDSKYYAIIAVATADNITGWTPQEAAQQLGADWGLAANDMLLLMVRNDEYYVACGDNVLAALNSYDTMQYKLKQAIEPLYANGDYDGAALAFYRQADVFYSQVQLGYSGGSDSDNDWAAPAASSADGTSIGAVIMLIIGIFVVWMLLDAVRYSRYRRRYVVGAPVNVVRPVYYPIFWGRRYAPPRPPRPPHQPRPPHGGAPRPPRPPMGGAPRPPRPSAPRPNAPRPSAPRPNAPRPGGSRPSAPRPSRPNRPSGGFGGGGFGGGSRGGGSRGGGFGGGGFGGGKRR